MQNYMSCRNHVVLECCPMDCQTSATWRATEYLLSVLFYGQLNTIREDEGGCGICSRIRVTDIGNYHDRFNPMFITIALLAKVLSHPPSRITAETYSLSIITALLSHLLPFFHRSQRQRVDHPLPFLSQQLLLFLVSYPSAIPCPLAITPS